MKHHMKYKGSITVFLCLCIIVCMGVSGVLLEVARLYGCQAVLSMAKQTAAQSIEAAYNQTLWREYALLAWDGQSGTDKAQMLQTAYQQWLAEELCPPVRGWYLYRMSVDQVSITSYETLLDEQGRRMLEQVLEAEESRYHLVLPKLLEETLSFLPSVSLPSFGVSLDHLLEKMTIHKLFAGTDQPPVSEAKIQADLLPSQFLRGSLQETAVEKALVCDYILQHCNSYTDHGTTPICYEAEYILGGEKRDALNLVSAARKVVKLRTGMNLLQILSEEEMHTTAELLGSILATCLAVPEGEQLVTFAVEACWAYREAVRDVQDLYQGKEVSVQKKPEDWHIRIRLPKEIKSQNWKLSDLPQATEHYLEEREPDGQLGQSLPKQGESSQKTVWQCLQDGGWNYECYLFLLLYLQDNALQMGRMMDVIQCNVAAEHTGFWLPDCCVGFSMDIQASALPVFSALTGQIGIRTDRRQLKDTMSIRFVNR